MEESLVAGIIEWMRTEEKVAGSRRMEKYARKMTKLHLASGRKV